jgi:hypothetical protein
MPNKCFASWASPNWTRPPQRRDKNRSCSDQPQNPPPYLLGLTGHNVKHALVRTATWYRKSDRRSQCPMMAELRRNPAVRRLPKTLLRKKGPSVSAFCSGLPTNFLLPASPKQPRSWGTEYDWRKRRRFLEPRVVLFYRRKWPFSSRHQNPPWTPNFRAGLHSFDFWFASFLGN